MSEVKIVFSAKIARQLLRMNYQIIDLKPHRDIPGRTVFIFKDVPGLKDDLRNLTMSSVEK